jgi:steroid 5-alpha reductase family enzyme
MSVETKRSMFVMVIVLLVASLITLAGRDGGLEFGGVALFVISAVLIFLIQWVAFIPAYLLQTERFYDLTGSITYLMVMGLAISSIDELDMRSIVLASLVSLWAIRLGTFLSIRIHQDGSDSRFDQIKGNFARFLSAWTLQGLWVLVTAGCALAAITGSEKVPLDGIGVAGILLWIVGFSIETIADYQKRAFRRNEKNKHNFIETGLWAYSRHPNYFGEILLWIGIALLAFPALSDWQLVTLISPLFVIFLLTKVSGIPLLEAKSDERWQNNEAYQAYKKQTPILIPKIVRPRK